jgi:hypothetical protein
MNFINEPIPLVDEIETNINSTFCSVDVCNKLILKTRLTLTDKQTLLANSKHLEVMLNKPWFVGYLEPEQLQKITETFNNSQAYILANEITDENHLRNSDM